MADLKSGKDYIGVAVAVVIVNKDNKVLLMKRGPKSKNEIGTWVIPGGAVDFGEKLEHAAVREVKEELGVGIKIIRQLGAANHIMPKENQHWVSTIHLSEIISGEVSNLEPEKCSEIGWFALDEIPALPLGVIMTENLKVIKEKWNE